MITAQEALNKLKEGNKRFVSGNPLLESLANSDRRIQLQSGQEPFAIILGCSDSRVPAEIVFDYSLGHLFVVRVAGNIVAPSQLGSIEYATSQFGTRLVVVMGHSGCGAVSATIDQICQPPTSCSQNLSSIVNRLKPAVEPLIKLGLEEEELLNRAVRANILHSVEQLRSGSEILSDQIKNEGLHVVGAQYSLSTGKVDFL